MANKRISEEDKDVRKDINERGVSGLEQQSGFVDEEKLQQLRGQRGQKIYRQMADNDDTVGALLFAIEHMLRQVEWHLEPASPSPTARDYADFVTECKDDMSHPFSSFISEVLTMLTFGWSCSEIVYKRRGGPENQDPTQRSKYSDGLIGWRKFAPRAQETLDKWEFDSDGGVRGWWQQPPSGGNVVFLPIEKILLFKTTSRKNNPEGRSILRNAYVSWFRKKEIERIEAVGIERDMAGLPVMYVNPAIMDPNASADQQQVLAAYKKIVRNLRNDEQAGLVLPSEFDDRGNRVVELKLMSSSSNRAFDVDAVVRRYSLAILRSVMADVLTMGHEKVGSFALASSKTNMLATALASFLDEISDVLTKFANPRLMKLNAWPIDESPIWRHGDIEKEDVKELAEALAQVTLAGNIVPGGREDENWLRGKLGMPPADPTSPLPPGPQPLRGGNGPTPQD